jgi:hypothetical protein
MPQVTPCQLWTVNLYVAHNAPWVLNTTIKGAKDPKNLWGATFAPTWDMVGGVKHWEDFMDGIEDPSAWYAKYTPISYDDYTDQYFKLMNKRVQTNKVDFQWLLGCGRVEVGCHCPHMKDGERCFCHRFLLAERVFPKLASIWGYSYEYMGEWTPDLEKA